MSIKDEVVLLAKNLPQRRNDGTSNHWDSVTRDIKNKIIFEDISNFLHWHNIVETMFINSKDVATYEFNILSNSPSWPIYKEAIKDLWPGSPPSSTIYPESNNNAIHQLYHLYMFEQRYGSILNAKKIVEFGGGYGCLCSIIKKLGYTGEYIIIDFPEFHLIQKYYLNSLGITNFIQKTAPSISDFQSATFFAFWSLSESEPSFRQGFVNNYFSGLNNFLMSYQVSYDSYNNVEFFNNIKQRYGFEVSETHLEHIPQNFYIFGNKVTK
jgi:hypothetical protein